MKKKTKKVSSIAEDIWSQSLAQYLDKELRYSWSNKCRFCGLKTKHTAKCIENTKKMKRLQAIEERKEKIRRAKTITLTVGELEDKIANASYDRYDY